MTDTQDMIARAQKVFFANYPLQDIIPNHGDGCYLWDRDGKKYLDFAIGIAVASLGHNNKPLNDAIKTQIDKFMSCPASYVTQPRLEAAEALIENCCADKVFFCNSGAEAVEAALKLARAWAHENKSEDCKEFIAFEHSFHGRTMGAVSLTAKSKKQPQFGPYMTTHFATFNDIESVKSLLSDRVCAVIVEPVQGEGGLTPATKEFMQELRALTKEHKVALIFDEVQCGMGRIGHLYAHDYYGVEPDITSCAKGLGGGFPVGAMLAKDEFAQVFTLGTHGTTYGGNPVASAVVSTIVSELQKPGFMENVRKNGERLREGLKEIQRKSNKIEDVRGLGLMVGADVSIPIKDLLGKLRNNGFLATQAGDKTLRLTPPLIAGEREIDEALEIIEKTLQEF